MIVTPPQRVLVVGATGRIGEPVARRLLKDGFRVRLLARQTDRARHQLGDEFEYVQGDVTDPATLTQALVDVAGVHVSVAAGSSTQDLERVERDGVARVADLAWRLGVRRLTYVSGLFATETFGHVPQHKVKIDAEKAIRECGVAYTIFRPTYFMETLPSHIQNGRATIFGSGERPFHLLAAADFAGWVSRAFQNEAAANRIFTALGPEPIRLLDAFRIYRQVLAPSLAIAPTPYWQMRLINRFFLKGNLTRPLEIMELMDQVGEVGDPSQGVAILGAPTITVRQWCEAQRPTRDFHD